MTAHAAKSERPPFQFTLRQLLGAMAVTCLLAAGCYWVGVGPAIFLTVFFGAIAITIFLAARRHYFEALVTMVTGIIITSLL